MALPEDDSTGIPQDVMDRQDRMLDDDPLRRLLADTPTPRQVHDAIRRPGKRGSRNKMPRSAKQEQNQASRKKIVHIDDYRNRR